MNLLIVVDMQKDFISGALGTKEAVAIVPRVAKKIAQAKKAGKTIVFTNGCFDLVHAGHVYSLEQARACGELHVIVSVIAGGNEASVRLHERFGFRCGGTLPQVGFKHGAYRDIVQYYLLV